MLPVHAVEKEGRLLDLIETTPKMDLALQAIAPLGEAWRADPAIYRPWWQRREPREAAPGSLPGGLAPLPRKASEPMRLAVAHVTPTAGRAMPSCISDGPGNDAPLLHPPGKAVDADLGAAEGGLLVAGRDFPKQGSQSGGVSARPGLGAIPCGIVGCSCPRNGAPPPGMRRGGGGAAGRPRSRATPRPRWRRRGALRGASVRRCGGRGA
jgi:hypothetical protein